MSLVMVGSGLGLERGSGFVLGSGGGLGSSGFGRYGEGVTVNGATGNLVLDRTDELLIGLGPDAVVSRSYNSLATGDEDNGDGWRLGAQRRVTGLTGAVNTAGSTVTRIDWDGSSSVYSWEAGVSAYVGKEGAGAYDRITFAADVWTWTDGDSRVAETYDHLNGGRITATRDADGNALSYSYTGALLTRVTTAGGERTDLTWSGNNLTQVVTTLSGGATLTRVRYGYDGSNRLASVTTDLSPDDNVVADGRTVVTTYGYDGASKRVASISQTGGAHLAIAYVLVGSEHRVQSLTETSAAGVTRVTSLSYDTANRVTSVTDALGQVTKLSYDASHRLTRIELPPAQAGAAAQNLYYGYTANGDVATVQDGGGKTVTYGYDGNGNRILERDHAGNTVTRTFGAKNELLTETRYSVPDPDGAGAGLPGGAVTTRYAYDGENHLRFVVSAEGEVTEYDYDAQGRRIRTIAYADNAYDVSALGAAASIAESTLDAWAAGIADKSTIKLTETSYDFRGNVAAVIGYSATTAAGAGATAPIYGRTTYVYDPFGNLLSRQHKTLSGTAVFAQESFVHDGLGRLTAAVDMAGGSTSIVFTDSQNKSVMTLANGLVRTATYNLSGELVSQAESGAGMTTATATYAYDKAGRLRQATDASGRSSYHLYDAVGRKVADIGADGSIVEYGHDAADRLVRTIRYTNKVPAAGLTALGDANTTVLLSSIRPTGAAGDQWEWRVYDGADRLIEVIDGDGAATVLAYDGLSNLVRTTRYHNVIAAAAVAGYRTTTPTGLQLPGVHANDRVSRNFHDKDGRLVGTLDGAGYLAEIRYNEAGEKVEAVSYANATSAGLRASGTFAQLLASVGASARDQRTRYVYDGQGQLRYTVDALLGVVEHAYDLAGNVLHTIAYGGAITATANYTMAYVAGQITSLGLAAHAATRGSHSIYAFDGRLAYGIDAGGLVTRYDYDTAGQVVKTTRYATKATPADHSIATMDTWAAGQAANAGNRVDRMIHDLAGRLAYAVDAEGFVTEYRHDAAGRVTLDIRYPAAYTVADGATRASMAALIGGTIPAAAVQRSYSYDSAGRLSDSYDGEGVRTNHVHDALGRVTDVTVAHGTADAATTRTSYDAAGRVASVTWGHGQPEASTTSYSYDGLGNMLTMVDGLGRTTSYAHDALGRVLSVTRPIDGSTMAVTASTYDAFGNVLTATDPRGHVRYFFYDTLNRMTLEVDAEGHATGTSYGVGGEVASVTRYFNKLVGTPTPGVLPTVTSDTGSTATPRLVTHGAEDATTSFIRDKLGRVTRVTDALGFYEEYTLNAFGDRTTVRNKLGGNTTNVFDKRGLLKSETLPMASVNSAGATVAGTVTNSFSYDARGNRTQRIEAAGLSEARTTGYEYDKRDRLVRTIYMPVAVASNTSLDPAGAPVADAHVAYDRRGNVIETKDAADSRTLFYYDDLDRKVAQLTQSSATHGSLSTWVYDRNGNATAATVYETLVAMPATAGGAVPSGTGNARTTSFAYDHADRLTTSTVAGLRTGYWNGTSYVTATGGVTTTNVYDKAGNIIRQQDGRGNSVWFFYDKLGRKVGQVDQELYFTRYTLDADGNVTSETRFANKLSAAPTAGTLPASPTADAARDRTTSFTYDRNGRRLTEARTGVVAWTVDGATGALTAASTTATVSYAYNGLGLVTRKTEATGDYVDYAYDAMGRQTSMTSSAFADHTALSVQRRTSNSYNGLNNLTRTVQSGIKAADGTATADAARVTTFAYNAAGLMTSMTDPVGGVRKYAYDIAGRMVRDYYTRTRSDGTTTLTEGMHSSYDAGGRVTAQGVRTWNGASWAAPADAIAILYNGYGDIAERGIDDGNATTPLQERFFHDNGGRLWKTTAGDGTTRLFLHDAAGNQTLTVASSGAAPSGYSWSSLTVEQAVTLLTANGTAAIGTVSVPGMVVTISAYDKRNQAVETREPLRETTALGASLATLSRKRVYNAFGEVIQEVDARNNATDFAYNMLGKLIEKKSPAVSWTAENGTITTNARPTETYYHDISGRLVGIRDANQHDANPALGLKNSRTLLAGTGYEGAEAQVTKEFHADTGILANRFDVFGDLRARVDEIGRTDSFTYDRLSRMLTHAHQERTATGAFATGNSTGGTVQLIDNYAYDILGQRTRHWLTQVGATIAAIGDYVDRTDYDAQGRVTATVDMGGNTTSYGYAWDNAIATSGLGTFGGWTKTTTNAAGKTATEKTDFFGRTVDKIDFGNHDFNYSFDLAGRLTLQTNNAGEHITNRYYNTGLIAQTETNANLNATTRKLSSYTYDLAGNRLTEAYTHKAYNAAGAVTATATYQNATVTWDALNRMVSFDDAGAFAVSIDYEYDRNGNTRRILSSYKTINNDGIISSTATTKDHWFKYDSMDRFVTTKGILSGTNGSGVTVTGDAARGLANANINRGFIYIQPSIGGGWDIEYDLSGQRVSAAETIYFTSSFTGPNWHEEKEYYSYTADGYLYKTSIGSVICPLLSGPISILELATKEEWNGEEAQAGRDHRQVA